MSDMLNSIGWIVVVNLILYFRRLRHRFVSDDFSAWKNPPVPKGPWHKLWLQASGQMKIYAKSVQFVRANGKWFMAVSRKEEMEHFFAIFLHICICVSIYFAFGSSWVSFVAAMLYSVNPVNNQGTIWPSGRGYVYPILFLLLAIAMQNVNLVKPLAWHEVSPVSIGLAGVFLWAGAWYTAGFLSSLTLIGSKAWYLLGFMPIVWFIHSRKFQKAVLNKHNTECFTEDKIIHPKKLILAIKSFGFYFILCLFPWRITFYHNFLQSSAGSMKHKNYTLCRFFWAGLFVLSGMVYYGLHQWDTFIWSLLAFLIGIIPFCNLWRANQEIAERFAALPNVFLMYALAQVIAPYPHAFTAILAFYATRTMWTLKMYQDEFYISEIAICEDEHAWWAWHCNAMKRWEHQSYREALILWVRACMLSPNEFKLLINIATCLKMVKNDAEAEIYLKRAEANIVPGQEKTAMEYIEAHRKGNLPILM